MALQHAVPVLRHEHAAVEEVMEDAVHPITVQMYSYRGKFKAHSSGFECRYPCRYRLF